MFECVHEPNAARLCSSCDRRCFGRNLHCQEAGRCGVAPSEPANDPLLHAEPDRYPIIVLGDSIVEASTLPRELCGHAIVNAGLDGASTTSELGGWLLDALDGKTAAAIVIALGINDALGAARDLPQFEENYGSLVATLSKATAHVIMLGIPPLDASSRLPVLTRTKATPLIDSYNAALPALAVRSGTTFAALPPLPTPHTIDGVHLSAAGYELWNEAILKGASVSCGSK